MHLLFLRFHNRVVDRLRRGSEKLRGVGLFESTWMLSRSCGRLAGADPTSAAFAHCHGTSSSTGDAFNTTSQPEPTPNMRIDTILASPLFDLPPDGASLAQLNLHRGRVLGLPAGGDVGQAPLSKEELRLDASSYARQWPDWTPEEDVLARAGGAAHGPGSPWVDGQDFTMADLVRFTDPASRTPDPSDPDE